ncbi:MAG: DUF6690 family protein [Pirellulaceae bacterium]
MLFSGKNAPPNNGTSASTATFPSVNDSPLSTALPAAPANDNPFQLAGSRRPISGPANNTATVSPASPDATLSQPVYWAFTSPAEYIRFDITRNWITTRWSRVSTVPGEDNLTGLRVALVSGPRPQDIHGSLTYYFDASQQVQRIAIRGWTGNSGQLVDFVTRGLGMQQRNSAGAGLYTATSWGKLKAVLRVDNPPVLRDDAPTEQLMVLLEANNPQSSLAVSRQVQDILAAMENGAASR